MSGSYGFTFIRRFKMKILFVSLLFIFSATAFGEMKPKGTFVASQCSTNNDEYSICVGKRVGYTKDYLSVFQTQSQLKSIFLVQAVQPVKPGPKTSHESELWILSDSKGKNIAAIVTYKDGLLFEISVNLPDASTVVAGEFRAMMHTM